jgi:hypothetical protein
MPLDWTAEISSATLRLKQTTEEIYSLSAMKGASLKWEDVHRLNFVKERVEQLLIESKEHAA